MAHMAPLFDGREEGGYVVRRPRATDGLGHALRASFAQAVALPEDMARLLDRLDRSQPRFS